MKKSSEIRVLHLIDSSGVAGGERYLFDLIRHSDPLFDHHIILSTDGPFVGMLKEHNCRYTLIDMEPKFSVDSIRRIRKYIRENKIEIVHTHSYRCNLYGRLACLFMGVVNLATAHVSLYDYLDTPPLVRRIYLIVERITSLMASKYICISAAMRDDLRRMGISDEKLVVIHNGVDLDAFYPRALDTVLFDELGIGDNRPVIGTVGRMVTEKGQVHLIDALRRLGARWPRLRCLFIGTGPLLEELKKYAKTSGLAETCIFPGVRADIANIYSLMDIFVLPSIREPFGLVLLEAMASRVPIIATASGGPLEFIRPYYNGILVSPANPGELSSQIEFLLSQPVQSSEMAQRGYESVKEKYGIKNTVSQVCDVYLSFFK